MRGHRHPEGAAARGTAIVRSGDTTAVFIVDTGSAVVECSIGEGDFVMLEVALHDLKSGARALLTVTPTGGAKVGALEPANAVLVLPSGEIPSLASFVVVG